jgi:hypothetical protein
VGWPIAMKVRIAFKVQVTDTPGFHSLYDWCHQMMWLLSGVLEDPDNNTVMELQVPKSFESSVKRFIHAIQTEVEETKLNAAHPMIWIATPFTIKRRFESKVAN